MRGVWSGLKEAFSKPAFLACVIVLAASAIGLEIAEQILDIHFRKLPVPLRRPLDQLNTSRLLPEYEFVAAHAISPDMLDELGTDQYLNCVVRDTRSKTSEGGYIRVLVTYYTGDPGQVPHVPDVCYLGGGYQRRGSRKEELAVASLGKAGKKIPIQIISFGKQSLGDQQQVVVLYTFSANGRFECDRHRLRLWLGNPFARHAYFSKVEISMSGSFANGMDADQGMGLLRKLLPILVSDHWPDWGEVTHSTDKT